MKIQCDVCNKDEASVYCVSDEAALCAACDRHVHHANKLAGKHKRFTLHNPNTKELPICDICQERGAFLFCQQDRAILCRECDVSIHKANEHTQKHTRFILTGVKLSANSTFYSESEPDSSLTNNKVSDSVPSKPVVSVPNAKSTTSTAKCTIAQSTTGTAPVCCDKSTVQLLNGGDLNSSISTSSISEYLMETLPGWHVEDFLDSSCSSAAYGLSKNGENNVLPLWDAASLDSNLSAFPSEKMGFWVPQVLSPPPLHHQTQNKSIEISFGGQTNGFKEQQSKDYYSSTNIKFTRKWSEDNSFAVPQISQRPNASKKSRNYW